MEDSVSKDDDDGPKTIAQAIDEAFPHYLAMGMSPEQYWEQDCTLVIAYRRAYRIKQEEQNRMAWLQGLYFYEALCDVSPVLHAFAKSGTRVRPYSDKPIDFGIQTRKTKKQTNQDKMDAAADFMTALAARFNRQNERKKEGEADEHN